MPATQRLQRFVDDELARAGELASRVLQRSLAALQTQRNEATVLQERQVAQLLLEQVPRQAPRFEQVFAAQLREAVGDELAGRAPARSTKESPSTFGAIGGLSLVDESRVEADIEISRAAQAIQSAADWELRELTAFTSTLAGQAHVSPETNPLRPLVWARALWEACGAVSQGEPRAHLSRVASTELAAALRLAFAAASSRLESQGVEPGIYRTVVHGQSAPPGAAPAAPVYDVTRPGSLEALLPRMSSQAGAAGPARGVGELRIGLPGERRPGARRRHSIGEMGPAFAQALARLDTELRRATDIATLAPHRAALLQHADALVDRQIVELISRLFDGLMSDSQLPAGLRTSIGRVQAAALRVALIDAAMLDTHEHPVWWLLDELAASWLAHPREDDPRHAAFVGFAATLVDELAQAPGPDAPLFRGALTRLVGFVEAQRLREEEQAAATIAGLQRAEQQDDLSQELRERLVEQLRSVSVPATLRRFITLRWSQVLATAMLAHGENAPQTTQYLRALDDLVWSLRLPDHPQSRQRLLAVLPTMLGHLREGMASIGMPQAERDQVLDALMAVHTEALRGGREALAAAPAAAIAEPEPTSFADSLIDVASLDTVPADALPTGPAPQESTPAAIQPGARLQAFVHGRWTALQLLWRSPRGRYLLFSTDTPGRPVSITQSALDRLQQERLARPAGTPPLIQRAVDRLLRESAT